jgi:hypothetical protein
MKKYLLGLFAVALAVGFSAFTSKPSNFTTFYIAEDLGTEYLITTDGGSSLCDEGDNLCQLKSTEDISGVQDKAFIEAEALEPGADPVYDRP